MLYFHFKFKNKYCLFSIGLYLQCKPIVVIYEKVPHVVRCLNTSPVFGALYEDLGGKALLEEDWPFKLLLTCKDFDPFPFCPLCPVLG